MRKFLVPLCSAALLSLLPLASRASSGSATAGPSSDAGSSPVAGRSFDAGSSSGAGRSSDAGAPPPVASPRPDTPQPLSLEAAIERALGAHPRLRAAAFDVEAADGAVRQAALPPNPTLSLEQEDTRRETRTVTVLLSQPLEIGGQRAARTEWARRGRDLAQAELDTVRAELRAEVVQAFFVALLAQERLQSAEESLRIAGDGAGATARRVAAGKLSPIDETRARVAVSTARIEWRQAQAEQLASRHALAAAIGVEESTIGALDGRADALPPLPDAAEVGRRLADAPALRRARLDVEQAQAAYDLARTQRIPDLTVSLGAKRSQEIGRSQAVIGVSLPLPLFDRNQGAQREALKRRQAAEQRAEAELQRLRAEVLAAADELRARADEVQALRREVLPGAREAYTAASRGFELGKFGFLDVLDAQRTWLQARTQLLDALAKAYRAQAELDRRLGAPAQQP